MSTRILRAERHLSARPHSLCANLFMVLLFTGLVIWAEPVKSAETEMVTVVEVVVIDETGRGVESEIRQVDDDDKHTHFAYTNNKGVATPNRDCSTRHRLLAIPNVNIYSPKKRGLEHCNKKVTIELMLTQVANFIFGHAVEAEKQDKYGMAAMLFSEAAWRATTSGLPYANQATRRAYENVGSALGIKFATVHDPDQDKYVLGKHAVDGLKAFQRGYRLPVSGKADIATLQALAGQPVSSFIGLAYHKAYKELGIK